MTKHEIEDKVDEFCNENGIDMLDPIRGLVVSAFYSGVQAEREWSYSGSDVAGNRTQENKRLEV